jgi:hypothetical protein
VAVSFIGGRNQSTRKNHQPLQVTDKLERDMEHLREVNISDAKSFAQQYNMIDAIETSAKENTNVEQVFKEMATVSKI